MQTFDWFAYSAAAPEMFLAIAACTLLMLGVFLSKDIAAGYSATLSRVSLAGTLVLVVLGWHGAEMLSVPRFSGGDLSLSAMFVVDGFSVFVKSLILMTSFFTLYLSKEYLTLKKIRTPEYYVLHLLCVLGMMIMVSAHDLIMLYVGLETMSFCLYILAAYHRDEIKSSEAGLKYFVLGSLASGIMLYGLSLLYGLTGTTSFAGIEEILMQAMQSENHNVILSIALVLLLTGFAFKISAVPFHMWTPDVYEGSPTPVTAFMAAAPKIAAFALLIRLLHQPLLPLIDQWSQVLAALSVLTMAVGSLMAIVQTDLKRLLAYSSIGHVGFILVGLTPGNVEGIQGALIYLVIYSLMMLGAFAVMLSLRRRHVYLESIASLSGLGVRSPFLAAAMLVFMFSLAGIPPFAGFFAKFYAFSAAVKGGYTWLAICGVVFSVVAAYYCLKIVKVMYFEEGKGKIARDTNWRVRMIAFVMMIATIFVGMMPAYIADAAMIAASSLF